MKPFNLEAALAGAPVVTRDGRKVKILHVLKNSTTRFLVIDIIFSPNGEEEAAVHTLEGNFRLNAEPCYYDLFMAPTKVTKWINVYGSSDEKRWCSGLFSTEMRAKENANREFEYICTVEVEWEE